MADPPPPEAHQFDFWIGVWEARWQGAGSGTNVISSEFDARVILERASTDVRAFASAV
jgi:hypothetical protein